MSVATGSSEAPGGAGGGGGARVFFQSSRGGGGGGGSPGSSSGSSREDSAPLATAAAAGQVQQQQQQQQRRHQQGKVTVKYDRKELRKRLVLEEWIVEQLGQLYGCEVRTWATGRQGPGLPRQLCLHGNSPGLRGADSPRHSPGSKARRVPFPRCLPAPGRSDLDAAAWAQRPRAGRAAGPLHGCGFGSCKAHCFSPSPGRFQLQLYEAGLGGARPSCA